MKTRKLKVKYMIGDGDGDLTKTELISNLNPFLKHITGALDRMTIQEGSWGLMLGYDDYTGNYKEGNISELEYDLLCIIETMMNEDFDLFFKKHKIKDSVENINYICEFEDLLKDEDNYNFLIYKGYSLGKKIIESKTIYESCLEYDLIEEKKETNKVRANLENTKEEDLRAFLIAHYDCSKYEVPLLMKSEIIEIMMDIEKQVVK